MRIPSDPRSPWIAGTAVSLPVAGTGTCANHGGNPRMSPELCCETGEFSGGQCPPYVSTCLLRPHGQPAGVLRSGVVRQQTRAHILSINFATGCDAPGARRQGDLFLVPFLFGLRGFYANCDERSRIVELAGRGVIGRSTQKKAGWRTGKPIGPTLSTAVRPRWRR